MLVQMTTQANQTKWCVDVTNARMCCALMSFLALARTILIGTSLPCWDANHLMLGRWWHCFIEKSKATLNEVQSKIHLAKGLVGVHLCDQVRIRCPYSDGIKKLIFPPICALSQLVEGISSSIEMMVVVIHGMLGIVEILQAS